LDEFKEVVHDLRVDACCQVPVDFIHVVWLHHFDHLEHQILA